MNDLQLKEYRLLEIFINICNKLHIQYFLVCGSAMGAVKYHGFIPWDDDVDVALMRKDYELFILNAQKYLPPDIFLQNYKTDKCFAAVYSKLRDSQTTFIEKSASILSINHGIFIDVFPLDGYPSNKATQLVFEVRKHIYRRLLSVAYLPSKRWKRLLMLPLRILGIHRLSNVIAAKYEKMITKYDTSDSSMLCNHGNWQGRLDYTPKSFFENTVEKSFEGMKVTLPAGYHQYLSAKYGDYLKELPKSEQVSHHHYTIIDCNRPYIDYLKKIYKCAALWSNDKK